MDILYPHINLLAQTNQWTMVLLPLLYLFTWKLCYVLKVGSRFEIGNFLPPNNYITWMIWSTLYKGIPTSSKHTKKSNHISMFYTGHNWISLSSLSNLSNMGNCIPLPGNQREVLPIEEIFKLPSSIPSWPSGNL